MAGRLQRIRVLAPVRFVAFRRNEVATKPSKPAAKIVKSGGEAPVYFSDDDRQQRNTVALRDVDYVVEAHFELTDRAGAEDNLTKFVEMFERRLRKGQHFHQPYLGCREFPAEVTPAENAPDPIPEDRDLGIMLWDIAYSTKKEEPHRPVFFQGELCSGVMDVPADPESALAGVGEGGTP